MQSDDRYLRLAADLGYSFDGEIQIGGNYVPVKRSGNQVFISGQIPRVGDTVEVVGAAGSDVTLEKARLAAKICAMRALALLQRSLGSLDKVTGILRITVFVRCAADFTQQSEVADAASDLLVEVLGPSAAHTRTSIGVLQLPKGATVELDLVATTA